MTSRAHVIEALKAYTTSFQEEARFIQRFLSLLQSDRCYHRDHLPGHITGSAWITNEAKTHVLLVHHAKLNRWLQPGGHADGDENIIQVALREAEEETGVKKFRLHTTGIFDLDIHPIPARTDFPEHDHYDIRIAVTASMNDHIMVSDESHDVRWVSFTEVAELTNHHASIRRMIEKTIAS